jgi:hypothetical protein
MRNSRANATSRANVVQTSQGKSSLLVARWTERPGVFSISYRALLLPAAPVGGFEPRLLFKARNLLRVLFGECIRSRAERKIMIMSLADL